MPTTSRWRSPCPCALKAHEACLLDWIADLEGPGKKPQVIQCPQCKAKLVCKRPRSLVADGVRALELATAQLTLPFVVVTLAGTVITGFWLHGFSTVYLVFGPGEADHLLGLDLPGRGMHQSWGLSLPVIPLALIASRTHYRLVDQLFGSVPLGYFYWKSQTTVYDSLWPPTPATTLAALAWTRLAYNLLYNRYLTPLEMEWLKQVKPRANEEGEAPVENRQGNGMQLELGLQIEIDEEIQEELGGDQQEQQEEQQQQEQPQPQQERPAADAAAQLEEILNAGPNGPQQQGAHPPQPRPGQRAEEIIIDLEALGKKAIGALLFPTISVAMGALLKMGLPCTWTTPPSRWSVLSSQWERYPRGLLQSRFGRTIVGGCLFVVLKDALQLYSKYQNAMSHKQRRIANYDEIPKEMKERLKDVREEGF